MKNTFRFLKPYQLQVYFALFLTLLELAAELLFPLFLGLIINNGIISGDMDAVIFWGSLMILITFITFTTGIINSYYSSHISAGYAYDIREKLFEKIQNFTFEHLSKFPTSLLVTNFTNDVRQVQNLIFMALRIMAKAPLMVIGGVGMSFIVNPRLASIFLITVPILIIFLLWVLKRGSKMFKLVQESVDNVNRVIQENIAGMRIIKAFVRRDFEKNRFTDANETLANETRTAFRFMEASMPILLFIMNLSLIFVLWFGNAQSLAGTTNVGEVVAIVNYALRIVMAISMFTFILLAFSRAKASAERLDTILDEPILTEDADAKTGLQLESGKVEFKNVSFHYPNDNIQILQNISFTLEPKEKLAVMGATGAGKTTLFQLIPRLYEPTAGEILLDDQGAIKFSLHDLRESLGYVPQSPLLFTGTIAENIKFGKESATIEEVIQAAKDAQIHETIENFPDKYNTIVGQKGVNLSGGQKQRISIARAFIRQPKILMFDDSTSALDLTTEAKLLAAVNNYNCSTIIITQKISTAKRADRILLIDDGKVLAIGSHYELLKTSTLYEKIVQSQLQKEDAHV